ncbi:uncharacterized protein TRUGW13939_03661 [Talaromyces rugulosus]|uniref:Uncharacterized protein n=1 Tax=Talaromyces rugulosus TaxID=121627 RepID=A0A7H8QRT4_TALRU|nr:uncharacterized protein TRUGW13939_03661 [Talaromyces rugulosus]QKX56556.1 hypothetical protein TRUGW13939_03661 [Talaromyces rugulosus]
MPPIRTFNSAPINQNASPTAAKDENNAATPQQHEQQQQQQQQQEQKQKQKQSTPFPAPATTTTTTAVSSSTVNSSAARPGASAVPGPTAAPVVPSPTKTYPLFETSGDTNTNTNTPAAPQPGARPVPFAGEAATPTTGKTAYTVPPPPKAGEPVQPAAYYAPKTQQQQTTTTPPRYPTQGGGLQEGGMIGAVPNSTSTPYMSTYQPPNAQPITSPSPSRFAGNNTYSNSNNTNTGPLYAGNDGEESLLGESGQKVYDAAKSWMQSAGTKLAEAEAEVWKMVNSK